MLWHFVLDHSAAQAARHIDLSSDSIGAIYTKLRVFFFHLGVFRDIYSGGDPREGTGDNDGDAISSEFALLDFHLKRVSAKRGSLSVPLGEADLHLAESYWRYQYRHLVAARGNGAAQQVMYDNLLAFIRRFGPVGNPNKPSKQMQRDARILFLEQFDQRLLWLERNAEAFRDADQRAALRSVRDI